MQQTIKYCDCCGKELVIDLRVVNPYHGFCAEIGYSSTGTGWGVRRDLVPEIEVEVCEECFSVLKQAAIKFRDELNKIKNGIKHSTKTRFTGSKV